MKVSVQGLLLRIQGLGVRVLRLGLRVKDLGKFTAMVYMLQFQEDLSGGPPFLKAPGAAAAAAAAAVVLLWLKLVLLLHLIFCPGRRHKKPPRVSRHKTRPMKAGRQ